VATIITIVSLESFHGEQFDTLLPDFRKETMLNLVRNSSITVLATGVSLSMLLSACTSPGISKSSRFVGFKEAITLETKALYTTSNLTEYSRVIAEAGIHAEANFRNQFSTTVNAPYGRTMIVRREFATGSFATNFGKSTEILFSIQSCSNISIQNGIPSCDDAAPLPAMTVRAPLNLKNGNSAIAQFPNGIKWTYEVLDQPHVN
jgi:hypothetical protein